METDVDAPIQIPRSGSMAAESDVDTPATALAVRVRLCDAHAGRSPGKQRMQTHTLKVLQRTRVSHLLISVTAYFSNSGYNTGDFDAYLLKDGNADTAMDPSKRMEDYGIRNNDIIDLRMKDMPLTILINIHKDDARSHEVSASLPVSAVVKHFCQSLGVENTKELSLAWPRETTATEASMSWLDPNKSLNAHGVQAGDTLLLRKKFFLFNEDIREAEENPLLRELLYNQLQQQQQQQQMTLRKKKKRLATPQLPRASEGSQSIENGLPLDDSVQMNGEVCEGKEEEEDEVVQETPTIGGLNLMDEVMMALTFTDKLKKIKELSQSQYHLSDFFPVKLADGTNCYFCVKSRAVCLTPEPEYSEETTLIKHWLVEDVKDYEQFENGIKLTVNDTTQVLFSDYSSQIVSYLQHMMTLIAAENEVASPASPEVSPLHINSPETSSESTKTPEVGGASAEEEDVEEVLEPGVMVEVKEVVEEDVIRPEAVEVVEITPVPTPVPEREETPQPEDKPLVEESTLVEDDPIPEEIPQVENDPQLEDSQESTNRHSSSLSATASSSSNSLAELTGSHSDTEPPAPVEVGGGGGGDEEAGIGLTFLSSGAAAAAMDLPMRLTPPPDYDDLTIKKQKKEKRTSIVQPSYFGLHYRDILRKFRLIYFVIMDVDIRPLVINVTQTISEIKREVCDTFGIEYPEEHYLSLSQALLDIMNKYGGVPKMQGGRFVNRRSSVFSDKSSDDENAYDSPMLNEDKPLIDQVIRDIQPCVLLLKRCNMDGPDAVDTHSLEIGEEWPDSEDSSIAHYRQFFQSWISVVQGACPVSKKTAIRIAALLVLIYHDKNACRVWPPPDLDCKYFLPECYSDDIGIDNEILKIHKKLESDGMSYQGAIDEVTKICTECNTSGVFFDVKVPIKNNKIMNVIPWKKMEWRKLCLCPDKVVCAGPSLRRPDLKLDLSAIAQYEASPTIFRLKFLPEIKQEDYDTYTYQARQIEELVVVYFRRGLRRSRFHPEKKAMTPETDI